MTEHNLWWRAANGEQLAKAVGDDVSHIRDQDSVTRRKDQIHDVMYSNRHVFSGQDRAALSVLASGGNAPIRLNVTRSMVDTIASRIGVNMPMVRCAADGALWTNKLRARRITRFLSAKMGEIGFRRTAPQCFRDAAIRGTGICKVTSEHGEIVVERIPKHELYVDRLAARYGKPGDAHHQKQYSRGELIARFPEHRSAIMNAPAAGPRVDSFSLNYELDYERSNMIEVTESWHLPSKPGADDGLHTFTIDGKTLKKEPWERRRFPFARLHWSEPQEGYDGTGLVEELAGIQWSIDQTVAVLEEGFRLGAPLRVMIQRGSKIVKSHINNMVGAIIEYTGTAPSFSAPSNPVSAQQINWLMTLFDWAYQITGISQMSASSKKPVGLESAPALQAYHDFETMRFATVEMAYELFHIDVANLMIDEAKALAEENTDYSASWVHRSTMSKVRWSEVDLDRDSMTLKLKPVNMITGSHAGKLERAQQLTQAGLVPSHWILPLFDNPDLERFQRIETGVFNYLEWTVERIMDESKEFPQPDSHMPLDLGITHVKAAYLDDLTDGAPETVLDRYREWITIAEAKQKKAASAVAAAQPSPMDPSMGGGGLPPGAAPETLPGEALPGAQPQIAA